MDLFPYLLPLVASLSLIFLVTYKRKSIVPRLPPGKTGWPIIGETLKYYVSSGAGKFINDRMKKYSPDVFKTSLLGEDVAVFCGASGNKFLFSNEKKLVTSWRPRSTNKVLLLPSNVENSSTEESPKKSNFLSEYLLKPEALQQYIGIMDSMARQYLETEWAPNREVKVLGLSKKYTLAFACRLFMSVDDPKLVARLADPFPVFTAGLTSLPINFPGTALNCAIKAARIMQNELLPIIRQRIMELSEKRESVAQDLLSRMLLGTKNGKFMNEMEVASKIIGLLSASHDATGTVITFMVNYLAEHPLIYNEVLKEQMEISKSKSSPKELLNWDDIQKMKYSWNVANEAMRLAPPSPGAFREAITDFTYAGYTIPKGLKAHWTPQSTHKNPKYFPNPEKFDPSRFQANGPAPYTFVPFGGGPGMCPGKEFARLEILVFMHYLVTKFKWEKLIPNEKLTFNPVPLPANGLPIRLLPHEK